MGTKTQSNQQNQYNPQSMGTYNSLQGGLGSTLNSYMTNPFGNPFFQTQQQLGTRQAGNLNQSNMSNLMGNINASGMMGGAGSPAALEMIQNQMRGNTANTANLGFLQPVQNAQGMQQFAIGQANAYRPLQTGQSQTQQTSGLGTWLPQVAGMALGGLTGGLGGGLMSMLRGPMGAAGAGSQFGPTGMSGAMNSAIGGIPNLDAMSQMPSLMGGMNPYLPPGGSGYGSGDYGGGY